MTRPLEGPGLRALAGPRAKAKAKVKAKERVVHDHPLLVATEAKTPELEELKPAQMTSGASLKASQYMALALCA